MKHKNKKRHDELAYAYYEQLRKNETLERTVAMYKKYLEEIATIVKDFGVSVDSVGKA